MGQEPIELARRQFLTQSFATLAGCALGRRLVAAERRAELAADDRRALIAISLDLEMSREYPARDMLEWDFQKGNLDEPTKQYAVQAARVAKEHGGLIHFFCVGRVLEQPKVDWLKELAAEGHPIGNHTYDHVDVKARSLDDVQFRFKRSPWLVKGKTAEQTIRENIRMTQIALQQRCGLDTRGFRTPGGFRNGLVDRVDVQNMLLELGYTWVSSKYPHHAMGPPKTEPSAAVYADIVAQQAQSQPFVYPGGLVEIPMSPITDVVAFRANHWQRNWYLKSIRQAVDWAIDTGGVFDLVAHPSCLVVEDPQFETVKLVCDLVKQAGDRAAIVDLDIIAERATLRRPS